MRKITSFFGFLVTFFFLIPQMTFAQAPVMDTDMIRDGKIYVVVAVMVVIFIGILLFLFRMERKIRRLEREERNM